MEKMENNQQGRIGQSDDAGTLDGEGVTGLQRASALSFLASKAPSKGVMVTRGLRIWCFNHRASAISVPRISDSAKFTMPILPFMQTSNLDFVCLVEVIKLTQSSWLLGRQS